MWEALSEPWRECIDQAWEAYCAGSLPIGAVVTDSEGRILAAGRSRREERSGPPGAIFGHKLAHAEINALLALDLRRHDPRTCVLYTTTEPCPLCAGALRMADLAELRFASREPWAGSAAMFETVPYLKNGKVCVVGPQDGRLEAEDGSLVDRNRDDAMVLDPNQVAERVARMAKEGVIWSVEGSEVHVIPRTICFHPDTPGMLPMLEKARRLLTKCAVMVDKETRAT